MVAFIAFLVLLYELYYMNFKMNFIIWWAQWVVIGLTISWISVFHYFSISVFQYFSISVFHVCPGIIPYLFDFLNLSELLNLLPWPSSSFLCFTSLFLTSCCDFEFRKLRKFSPNFATLSLGVFPQSTILVRTADPGPYGSFDTRKVYKTTWDCWRPSRNRYKLMILLFIASAVWSHKRIPQSG